MKTLLGCIIFALAVAIGAVPANAKGCLKGAVVGGTAGHFAGHHGLLGQPRDVPSGTMKQTNNLRLSNPLIK